MILLRYDIGSRFNAISSSLTCKSYGTSEATALNAAVVFTSTASSSGTSSCSAVTTVLCYTAGTSSGTSVTQAITANVVFSTGTAEGVSEVLNTESVFNMLIQGTSECTAETSVVYFASAEIQGSAVCVARPYIANDIYIAALDSPDEDKIFADYVCTGAKDQMTILTAVLNRTNMFCDVSAVYGVIPIKGKITLRFARGVYNCDSSFEVKDVDMIGAGSNITIFEFTKPNTSPTSMFKSVLEMRVKTSDQTTLDSFMVSASGVLHLIYDDTSIFTAIDVYNIFNVKNVYATNLGYNNGKMHYTNAPGKIMVEVAYPQTTTKLYDIPLVRLSMTDCKVSDTDYSGFLIYGDRNNNRLARAFDDIYMKNCHANKCGVRDDGAVVAGFNLLTNITTENIRMENCTSHDNWHAGFYFDDARVRTYTANGKSVSGSNIVYNLFMENCRAQGNGQRSALYTSKTLLPFCSGFVLREFSDGTADVTDIPQFSQSVPTYPTSLRTARGPYASRNSMKVAYGNLVNCYATNNRYAGFYSRGYKHNTAELNIRHCYASGSSYSLVADNHDGLYVEGLVSDTIASPTVMLKSVDTITIQYMRIIDSDNSQYITMRTKDEYDNLMLQASRYIEVND